jgi:hypothetical protein
LNIVKWQEPSSRIALLLLVLGTILCLRLFIEKPFHIDDPLVVWAARQIQSHPADFYGFDVNWYGHLTPMSRTETSPPLTAYYLAAVGCTLGWTEAALHSGFILPALALVLGTYGLAKRLCPQPLLAAAATLAAPVFMLCASTLMRDTLLAAFWVWAIYFWILGLEERPPALALAALMITACSLTKYFGLALIPLLLAFSIFKKRKAGLWLLWLLLPLLAMAGYELWAEHLYGKGLIFNATHYANATRPSGETFSKAITGLAFTGGCTFLTVAAMPLLLGKRALGICLLATAGLALVLALMKRIGVFDMTGATKWLVVVHLAVLGCGGALVFALAIFDIWTRRTAESLLLFLWIAGVFLFAAKLNWTISGRNMLPLAPAVALLVVRRIEQRKNFCGQDASLLLLAPVAVTAALALILTWADTEFAFGGKGAAQIVARRFEPQRNRVEFQGHWGFQYYMQEFGAQPINSEDLALRSGDIIVVPLGNSYPLRLPQNRLKFVERYSVQMPSWISVHNFSCGAGYYSDNWGPCPYLIGAGRTEDYAIFKVN